MKILMALLIWHLSSLSITVNGQGGTNALKPSEPYSDPVPSQPKTQPNQSGYAASQPSSFPVNYMAVSNNVCGNQYKLRANYAKSDYESCINIPRAVGSGSCKDYAVDHMNQARDAYYDCQKKSSTGQKNSNNAFQNGNNLVFGGTPEQQQAALQRQQLNQNIGSVMGSLQNSFAQGSQQNVADFANKTADNQGKVDAINNQNNQNQPRDEKGIMGAARSNNLSTDTLVPEPDEDDKKTLNDPEVKRLTQLTDAQFEAERQRMIERNKDRPNDTSPNYDSGTSRLAESEREIRRHQADNSSNSIQSTTLQDQSDEATMAGNVRQFIDGLQDKGFDWANFTDEEKAKAAYIGYMAISASQSIIGNFLYAYSGPVGALHGLTLGAIAVSDAMVIQNPFLNKSPKK